MCNLFAAYVFTIRTDDGEDSLTTCARCLEDRGEVTFFPEPTGTARPIKAKRIRKLAQEQDQQVMGGLTKGRVQPASGSLTGYKGDGRVTGSHRIETKFTFAQTFKLRLADLAKIKGECWGLERPVVIIDFKDKRSGTLRSRWACIPHSDWEKYANVSTADDRRSENNT